MGDLTKPELTPERLAICRTVIDQVFQGETLPKALKAAGLHPNGFYYAVDSEPELRDAYARARIYRAERAAEEIIEIADGDEDAQRARNRITARQWYAGKVNPKQWGDRLEVNVQQTVDIGSALQEARARAVRPVSDQRDTLDAQTVEFTEVAADRPTDGRSAARKSAPKKKPAKAKKGAPSTRAGRGGGGGKSRPGR